MFVTGHAVFGTVYPCNCCLEFVRTNYCSGPDKNFSGLAARNIIRVDENVVQVRPIFEGALKICLVAKMPLLAENRWGRCFSRRKHVVASDPSIWECGVSPLRGNQFVPQFASTRECCLNMQQLGTLRTLRNPRWTPWYHTPRHRIHKMHRAKDRHCNLVKHRDSHWDTRRLLSP